MNIIAIDYDKVGAITAYSLLEPLLPPKKVFCLSNKILLNVKKSHIIAVEEAMSMLIRFAVENFLSFKEMAEFSMIAGKVTRHSNHIAICNHKRVLKGAFVFGANASGKTNLIRAVDFARDIITQGLESTLSLIHISEPTRPY